MPPDARRTTHPLVFEINTRCWLRDLAARHSQAILLSNAPEAEFELWLRRGFTHIWLMGVWTTGPRSRDVFLSHPDTPPRFAAELEAAGGVPGSPYAIAAYEVPAALGGEDGLRQFRERLHRRGLKLLLDFVPNHVGLDHPWLSERPEFFVQSPEAGSGTFLQQTRDGPRWIAHGKDPYFPPWADTAQLDFRSGATRAAVIDVLRSVAARCDGVRCDMAMLLLGDVFARNWEQLPCPAPTTALEFWSEAITAVRRPDFLFLAEAYWDLEERLQSLGFDFTYDKRVTDFIIERRPRELQRHLLVKGDAFVRRCAHFLENHDEPRIASRLSLEEHRAAALLTLGLPGMRLVHEGQLEGARLRAPIELARRVEEPVDPGIAAMYDRFLAALPATAVGFGRGHIVKPFPVPCGGGAALAGAHHWLTPADTRQETDTHQDVVIVWWLGQEPAFDLVAVNLSENVSTCWLEFPMAKLAEHEWEFRDFLGNERFTVAGAELRVGLLLQLRPHAAHLFHVNPIANHPETGRG